MAKAARYSARDLKREKTGHYWHYIVSAFENTPKNLMVQERVQSEHSSHIVKVSVKANAYISIPDEGNSRTSRPIWNYSTGTLTFWKGC